MNIRSELKEILEKEVKASRYLSEIDKIRQLDKQAQKKRKDEIDFNLEINRIMTEF